MLAIARQRAADLGRDVTLREADAEHLPFDDASFDTVTCALALCTILSPVAALGEMRRILVPGGRRLLLDHIGSTWPPFYAVQRLAERVSIRAAGEHFTRRQQPLVTAAGFQIEETERLKAGSSASTPSNPPEPTAPACGPRAEPWLDYQVSTNPANSSISWHRGGPRSRRRIASCNPCRCLGLVRQPPIGA